MSVLPVLHVLNPTEHRILYYFFDLRANLLGKNIRALLLFQVGRELLLAKHVAFYVGTPKVFMVAPYGIVGEVDKLIVHVLCIVILS